MAMLITPTKSLGVQLAQGAVAEALLSNLNFQKAWATLKSVCPWATGCQSWEFAAAWFSVYSDLYSALFAFEYDKDDHLIGLLPLAVEVASGSIVHVGAHQAEYQVWLATEANANNFIERALELLALEYPKRGLQLRYLPPDTPLSWRRSGRRWSQWSILEEQRRPLLAVGKDSSIAKSLKKKATGINQSAQTLWIVGAGSYANPCGTRARHGCSGGFL